MNHTESTSMSSSLLIAILIIIISIQYTALCRVEASYPNTKILVISTISSSPLILQTTPQRSPKSHLAPGLSFLSQFLLSVRLGIGYRVHSKQGVYPLRSQVFVITHQGKSTLLWADRDRCGLLEMICICLRLRSISSDIAIGILSS
jgi:hypothetical protein